MTDPSDVSRAGDFIDFRDGKFNGPLVGKHEEHHHYSTFPCAPAEMSIPQQLPRPTAVFVGREKEMSALKKSLENPEQFPIVVIDGLAGVGKSSLVLQWAHQFKALFPDGQLYINLRGFDPAGSPTTPGEAIRAFLDAFQVSNERIPRDLEERAGMYRSLVSRRRLLIVLDNARDSVQVRPLLPGSQSCFVVVTSRMRMEGLIALNGARPLTLDLMNKDEAISLLSSTIGSERISAEPQETETLIKYCNRLPLALSLVAARAVLRASFSIQDFIDEIDEERVLNVLTSDDPWGSLRSVFSWSYRALSPNASAMFRFLGVYPGVDIDTYAASSLAGSTLVKARSALAELMQVHLLEEKEPRRYSFHDLLREYAAELISIEEDPEAAQAATKRGFDFYLHTAFSAQRVASPHWSPISMPEKISEVHSLSFPSRDAALKWFQRERENLILIIRYAASAGYKTHACKIPWTLADYLYSQGHWHDWKVTQAISLEMAKQIGDEDAEARAYRIIGHLLNREKSYDEALASFKRSLSLWHKKGDSLGESNTLLAMSWTCGDAKRYSEALEYAHLALLKAQEAKSPAWEARALNQLGLANIHLEDYRGALSQAQQSLQSHEARGDLDGIAHTLNTIGIAQYYLSNYPEAIRTLEVAVRSFRELGDKYFEADSLMHLGDAQRGVGNRRKALEAWNLSLEIVEQIYNLSPSPLVKRIREIGESETPS